MSKIKMVHDIEIGGEEPPILLSKIKKYVLKILDNELNYSSISSLTFVNEKEIRNINREYREKDESTNVLSFVFNETIQPENIKANLGEVYISLNNVAKDAKKKDISFELELYAIIVHGYLHLLGYDHQDESSFSLMRKKELIYLEYAKELD